MNILYVNACPREGSRTAALARYLLSHLEGDVQELPLYEENILPLNPKTLVLRDKLKEAGSYDHPLFKYAHQFASADVVVLAAPFWDLSFPSMVKVWFEQLMVRELTFRYDERGIPQGLCQAKKLFYVSTAGGPVGACHQGFAYVDALAKSYFGIPETVLFSVENLDVIGADIEGILADARTEIDCYWRKAK